jgi:hypothetical protein
MHRPRIRCAAAGGVRADSGGPDHRRAYFPPSCSQSAVQRHCRVCHAERRFPGVRQQCFLHPIAQAASGDPAQAFQIPNPDDTAALDAQLPPLPFVNPQLDSVFPGYTVAICNASTTTSHLIEGGVLRIPSFVPFVGSVNMWSVCFGFFSRSEPISRTSGGCGGSQRSDENLLVTFPPNVGVGSEATAVQVGQGAPEFGSLPVTLAPGKLIVLLISVTVPQAPGVYTFAVSVTADHTQLPFIPAGSPTLFAPVAHKFTGAACLSPLMQQQIPPATTPATFFICPEGVSVLPSAVSGKG